MKERELKEREAKIKRERRAIFQTNILSINYMDTFEEKEMKKIRPIKNTCYCWLITYISESRRKSAGGYKDKVISLFKTNTPKKQCLGEERNYTNQKCKKKSEENIINSTRNLFILKKER